MKLRTLPVALAAAAALLIPVAGLAPAYADPPASPSIDSVDSTTVPGTVSGTVSSPDLQPFVFVGLVGATDTPSPSQMVTLADANTFSFNSWGYGANTTVQAWACPTSTFDGTCSTATSSNPFTPTDVTVTPTWTSDTTIGPADSVTVDPADSTGGGVLFVQWTDDNAGPPLAPFALTHTGTPQTFPIRDGVGSAQLSRCDDGSRAHCVQVGTVSPTYTVKQSDPTASIGPVTGVSSASPTTTFDVTTAGAGNGDGNYTVTWHLELASNPGTPIAGYGTTTASTALASGVAQDVPLDATGLPSGDYLIVGTITVVDSAYGTYSNVPMTGGTLHSGGDITAPVLTSITAAPTTIYPLVKNLSAYPSSTKFTIVGPDVQDVTTVKLFRNSTGAFVRTLIKTPVDNTHATVAWSGLLADGATPAPAGLYLLRAYDASGNVSTTIGSVTVSGKKLVLKTWTHTYTPAGTLADKYIGKCSTLRKPSLRGWFNSLGYYANTKCTSQTSKDSLISTLHAVFLPKAVQYVDIHVTAYGGAAKAKPGSKAIIRYLTTSGGWTSDKTLSGTMGYHAGITRSTTGLVFKDHSFGWGFYTGFGYQYDVKSFTVVLHYRVVA